MTVTSDTTTNSTDIDQFIKAVDNDSYAELLLDNGDTLVTDWEGDSYFLPYVVPAEGSLDDPTDTEIQQRKDEICECISDVLNVTVRHIDYDNSGEIDAFYPFMDKP